ncbi:MAG TPA: hypothetical protein VFZ97_03170 [Acidimicrobiales bacterium]
MGNGPYLLQHQNLGAGSPAAWSTSYSTFDEARRVADEQMWTAGPRAIRQSISDTSTGEEFVRRSDGAWISAGRPAHSWR